MRFHSARRRSMCKTNRCSLRAVPTLCWRERAIVSARRFVCGARVSAALSPLLVTSPVRTRM
eukprot:5069302-Prymnesium_polylepis.2